MTGQTIIFRDLRHFAGDQAIGRRFSAVDHALLGGHVNFWIRHRRRDRAQVLERVDHDRAFHDAQLHSVQIGGGAHRASAVPDGAWAVRHAGDDNHYAGLALEFRIDLLADGSIHHLAHVVDVAEQEWQVEQHRVRVEGTKDGVVELTHLQVSAHQSLDVLLLASELAVGNDLNRHVAIGFLRNFRGEQQFHPHHQNAEGLTVARVASVFAPARQGIAIPVAARAANACRRVKAVLFIVVSPNDHGILRVPGTFNCDTITIASRCREYLALAASCVSTTRSR